MADRKNSCSKKSYRCCAVPNCKSTSTKNPDKIFFSSPSTSLKQLRKKWYQSMRRYDLGENTVFSVCEDHFDLENDLADKDKFNINNGKERRKLKAGVVPHIFYCQKDKSPPKKRHCGAIRKLDNSRLLRELFCNKNDAHSENMDLETENPNDFKRSKDAYTQCNFYNLENDECKINEIENILEVCIEEIDDEKQGKESYSNTDWSDSELEDSNDKNYSDTDWSCSESDGSNDSISDDFETDLENKKGEIPDYYTKYPREYVGLPEECIYLIKILSEELILSVRDIYIVLVKLRKNYTFLDIANQFNMRVETVVRIFLKTLPLLSGSIEGFIEWPSRDQIRYSLPLPFRCNFMDVECIIDCLEIETQKPENPMTQSFTFSNYKKCNTLKFLVGITPSGMITFISDAYSGRTSDMEIVKESKFAEKLPRCMVIMADRGFKGIAKLLQDHGHTLVRPPSVLSGEKLTKEEVKMTKQIASLRIHIERVIRRLREFKFFERHSCIHYKHQKYATDMIILAAAFVNLQPLLIKDN